jgi:hypothetical protein
MAQDFLEKWWTIFTDDPCDDVCVNIHKWITTTKEKQND